MPSTPAIGAVCPPCSSSHVRGGARSTSGCAAPGEKLTVSTSARIRAQMDSPPVTTERLERAPSNREGSASHRVGPAEIGGCLHVLSCDAASFNLYVVSFSIKKMCGHHSLTPGHGDRGGCVSSVPAASCVPCASVIPCRPGTRRTAPLLLPARSPSRPSFPRGALLPRGPFPAGTSSVGPASSSPGRTCGSPRSRSLRHPTGWCPWGSGRGCVAPSQSPCLAPRPHARLGLFPSQLPPPGPCSVPAAWQGLGESSLTHLVHAGPRSPASSCRDSTRYACPVARSPDSSFWLVRPCTPETPEDPEPSLVSGGQDVVPS